MTESADFRRCLSRFATGVTVVTCKAEDDSPRGITVNSFSSVSLDPPLVLWNIAKVSRALDAYLNAKHFGINVLSAEQESLAVQFARADIDPFAGTPYGCTERGVPQLDGTLAWFECESYASHDCGDHHIVIGRVLSFTATDCEPLLFFGSRYRALNGTVS